MAMPDTIIVITYLFMLLSIVCVVCAIMRTIIKRWKSCDNEKYKTNVIETVVKVAVSVCIVIICIMLYLYMQNS